MTFKMTGFDKAISAVDTLTKRAGLALDRSLAMEAQLFRNEVVKAFNEQGAGNKWTPLNVITLEMRKRMSLAGGSNFGGTKALIRSGTLRGSVKVEKQKKNEYFVGINRTRETFNLGLIHEQGNVLIPITEKMRKYFMYLFIKGVFTKFWPPPNKKFILIKRRSFMQETFDKFREGFDSRMQHRVQSFLATGKSK